jgi:hypothetical protein
MTAATNPLSYNLYIQYIAGMAVYTASENLGVWAFNDAPPQLQVPSMLNYAELRIQRDLDMLASQSTNNYTLIAGQAVFQLPVDDFVTVQTLEIITLANGIVINGIPLTPVSKEFIQNCYRGAANAGTPSYYAMYGDNFGDTGDSFTNILLGPPPNYPYTLKVSGTCRMPSLYKYAIAGPADSTYTYISAYYPDLLVMASMIYISAFQRNFSALSDDQPMPMTYEKQYQLLLVAAKMEENRRKQEGSSWTAYSTPVSATPTR